MLYLGGKGRTGRAIAETVLAQTARRCQLVEPFIGGANVTRHLAPHFKKVCVGDAHEDLVFMWRAAADGWVPPTSVTESEYAAARGMTASAIRAFIGFGCSYGGKWWGGYARNKVTGMRERSHPDYYARLASRDVTEIGEILKGAEIAFRDYMFWSSVMSDRVVVYADPPYRGTTRYRTGDFDHDAFWTTMTQWSDAGAHVFVSEYQAPNGWASIWSKAQPRKVSGGSGDMTTEHLFVRASH